MSNALYGVTALCEPRWMQPLSPGGAGRPAIPPAANQNRPPWKVSSRQRVGISRATRQEHRSEAAAPSVDSDELARAILEIGQAAEKLRAEEQKEQRARKCEQQRQIQRRRYTRRLAVAVLWTAMALVFFGLVKALALYERF